MIKAYGSSVIGTSHIVSNKPCHDSHYYQLFHDEKSIVACVSDGMGSASHAEIGSALASNFVVDYLVDNIKLEMTDEEIINCLKESYIKTHERLEEEAKLLELSIKDLNATLIVFLHLPENRQFGAQVGDCTAIGRDEDNIYSTIIEQQRGEYANLTFSVCNIDSVMNGEYFKIKTFQPYIAMMSDGIESFSISSSTNEPSKLFFEPFFNAFNNERFSDDIVSESLKRFLSSERVNKKTDDDKTLLLVQIKE